MPDGGRYGGATYEIGVEFTDLTDEDRTLIKVFIDYLGEMEVNAGREKADN